MTFWKIEFSIGNRTQLVAIAKGDDEAERIKAQIKDAKGKIWSIYPQGSVR